MLEASPKKCRILSGIESISGQHAGGTQAFFLTRPGDAMYASVFPQMTAQCQGVYDECKASLHA